MNLSKEQILKKVLAKDNLLLAKQNKISLPIVFRICKKMQQNLKFRPICVSSDNVIIDGHHRYLASLISNYKLEIVSNYPKPSFLNVYEWNNVEFIKDDWDSPSKIKKLNEDDAFYNDMSLEDVEKIIG